MKNLKLLGIAVTLLLLAACGGGSGSDGGSTPSLSVSNTSVTEGDSGTANLTFTVDLSAPASGDVTVDYATSDLSATAGSDYTAANGTLTILAGSTSGTVTVSVTGDTDIESNETLTLTLSNPAGATIATTTATGTINDDDSAIPLPTLSIADASVTEGDSGPVNLTFTVNLSAPASGDVTVDYATSDGTATAGSDYTAVSSSLTIVAGNTNGSLTVVITGDTAFESDETLTVTLTNPVGASLGTATATGTINNDDPPPPTATVSPSGLPLDVAQDVIILFSESMNTGSVVLGGALANDVFIQAWSMTSTPDDTLTLTPNTNWTIGDGVTLIVDGDNLDSTPNSLATLTRTFNVLPGIYYVSSSAADDSGDGLTPATAKRTIRGAIDQTVTDVTNPATVVVNAGTYNVNSDTGGTQTHVVLVNGVSLYGGYSSDFSVRDSALNESIVEDMSTAVVSNINLSSRALESGTGISSNTVVDGLTLRGSSQPGADYVSAVYVNNSAGVMIRNNQITGGAADFTYGVMVMNGGTATIENNTSINGGTAATNSHGVFVTNPGSSALIQNNNTIHGGIAGSNTSYGIYATSSAQVTIRQNSLIHGGSSLFSKGVETVAALNTSAIYSNRIFGGTGSTISQGANSSFTSMSIHNNIIHGGTGNNAYGVSLNTDNSAVRNNTIYASTGFFSVGINLTFASAALIDNNLIYSRSPLGGNCIYENTIAGDPASISNNNFSGCTATVYRDFDGGCTGDGDGDANNQTCTLAEMEALSGAYQNNTADDATLVFVDEDGADDDLDTITDNDWSLNTATGNIAKGGLNGIDASGWGFTDDFDGIARPGAMAGNWSIGAYEHP